MSNRLFSRFPLPALVAGVLCFAPGLFEDAGLVDDAVRAEDVKPESDKAAAAPEATTDSTSASSTPSSAASKPSGPSHQTVLKDAKEIEGLIPLYRKENKLYAELTSTAYSSEYLVLISISRGIGQGMLLGGMSWNFGDDWVWKFRKIDDNVHIIRRNVRFKATKGSPEASAVANAYSDSVLFSLPIITKGPKGGDLIDLNRVFMSDLPQISFSLSGFSFASDRSTWDSVKGFTNNIELQIAATYASSGRTSIDTVPDTRGVTLGVHYSISKIPTTGYKPREADDRVGYFLSVVKDFSKKDAEDQFVRYINRWKLEKADSAADKSPPKEPLIFWIEKTVPFKYRKPIRDGILEWNKAFYEAGFVDAIEVRQQPDDADWDPEDINYNTFRWITSNAGFAIGPSRVNPYTGQILDADILFDADFLDFWKQEFETMTPESLGLVQWNSDSGHDGPAGAKTGSELLGLRSSPARCLLSQGMSRQLAFGATALQARTKRNAKSGKKDKEEDEADKADEADDDKEDKDEDEDDRDEDADDQQASDAEADRKALVEKLIMQGLKEVTMHEVGHTLGLRHNFKGSTLRSLQEINDVELTRKEGMVASIMDYNPVNVVPSDWTQGDYYPTTIGVYDRWAIQYGYTQFSGSEEDALNKIAARSGDPRLKYATDEDTMPGDPDPESNRFDLGDDAFEYAKLRAQLMKELIPGLVDRVVADGDDYTKARKAFNVVVAHYGQAMEFAARYVGGLYTSRSHKGDKDARAPFTLIAPERQREALALLESDVFSSQPFSFPPELYNQLASSNWDHWGLSTPARKDFPVHAFILMWQESILAQLLDSSTLERMHDAELKAPADQDVMTTAELIQRLTSSIFEDVRTLKGGEYTNRKPAVNSLRRNLQRTYLDALGDLALDRTYAPDDCQAIALAELTALKRDIDRTLQRVKMDAYSSAHLAECSSRIEKVIEARLLQLSL